MSTMEFDYVVNFSHNIKKLKMITETISKFDDNDSIGKLETYRQLLEAYWHNCITANLDAGNDIPFDDNIFWWQTNGEQRYNAAREKLTFLLICYKVYILTKSFKSVSLHRVTYSIYHFNESTEKAMLESSSELLEQCWRNFLDSYSTIVDGNPEPSVVSGIFYETESYYMNARLRLKQLFHHHADHSQSVLQKVENESPNYTNQQSNISILERFFSRWRIFRTFLMDWVRLPWRRIPKDDSERKTA